VQKNVSTKKIRTKEIRKKLIFSIYRAKYNIFVKLISSLKKGCASHK